MNNMASRQLLFSIGIIALFSMGIIFLDRFGKSSRIMDNGHFLGTRGIKTTSVNNPEEAYRLWKQNGFKGRTVVSLSEEVSSAMPRVDIEAGHPLNVYNISNKFETKLDWKYFLSVSIETGIARKIIYVVPEPVFSGMFERAGIKARKAERIDIPLFGSPRTITPVSFFRPPDEPVLLLVCASIFKEHEPERLMAQLVESGMKTDFVVLCRACDSSVVADEEIERLGVFEKLTVAGNVKD
jgi:hypothetical protein